MYKATLKITTKQDGIVSVSMLIPAETLGNAIAKARGHMHTLQAAFGSDGEAYHFSVTKA